MLKEAFRNRFANMLTKLWQLDSLGVEAIDSSGPTLRTFSSEVFSHGFFAGVIDFAKEYSSLVEVEYLQGYDAEVIRCYVRLTHRSSLLQ